MDAFWNEPVTADEVEAIVDGVIARDGLPEGMAREALISTTAESLKLKTDDGAQVSRFWLSVLPAALIKKRRADIAAEQRLSGVVGNWLDAKAFEVKS